MKEKKTMYKIIIVQIIISILFSKNITYLNATSSNNKNTEGKYVYTSVYRRKYRLYMKSAFTLKIYRFKILKK